MGRDYDKLIEAITNPALPLRQTLDLFMEHCLAKLNMVRQTLGKH